MDLCTKKKKQIKKKNEASKHVLFHPIICLSIKHDY